MRDSILLVDQKHSTANLMKTYLRADGFAVDHTPNPKEAVVYASITDYSLVITDLYREIQYVCDRQVTFMFLLRLSSEELRLMGSLDRRDVIKKEPLSMNEVIAKVRAAITNNQ